MNGILLAAAVWLGLTLCAGLVIGAAIRLAGRDPSDRVHPRAGRSAPIADRPRASEQPVQHVPSSRPAAGNEPVSPERLLPGRVARTS